MIDYRDHAAKDGQETSLQLLYPQSPIPDPLMISTCGVLPIPESHHICFQHIVPVIRSSIEY